MSVFSIRHVTTYHYHQPVEFGVHRMMLRPRDDDDQKVIYAEIEITPKPKQLAWTLDAFGNHVAIARFADRAAELRFVSNIRLDHTPAGFHATKIKDFARTYPFSYVAEDRSSLESFIVPLTRQPEIDRWGTRFFRADGSADMHELLVNMTATIKQTFKHGARHEKGVRDPLETLHLGSGSCRDLAMFMIALLRSRGIAARFVSGYLHLPDDGDDDAAGGNTHAWVQVYVPGPGWVDFDPSGGGVGNENLIRVAVARHPSEAIPLQGTWFGKAADHSAMKVGVTVKPAADMSKVAAISR
jgi:transglutaminase-like putative cysteine protease